MAQLVFGMNQSLDGYVDHMAFAPSPTLFRHFIEQVRGLAGSVYGRRMYEVMRYWDEDHPEWDAAERDFATAWRSQPKWVVSRTLKSVGPNATLVANDLEATIRQLKAELDGEIDVAGPDLARSLTDLARGEELVEGAYLAGYSPYHTVRADRRYPVMTFVSALNDRIAPPHDPLKMTARRQAEGTGGGPSFLLALGKWLRSRHVDVPVSLL